MKLASIKRAASLFVVIVCAAVLSSGLCGCGKGEENIIQVSLSESEIVLDFFEEHLLTAAVEGGEGEVVWESSDTAVAAVENGMVSARGVGRAVIRATFANAQAECAVEVRDSGEIPSVRLSENTLEIETGRAITVTAEAVYKNNVIAAEFAYQSNDEAVAAVTQSGRISAVGAGTTQIIVRATINGVTVYGEVSVTVPR